MLDDTTQKWRDASARCFYLREVVWFEIWSTCRCSPDTSHLRRRWQSNPLRNESPSETINGERKFTGNNERSIFVLRDRCESQRVLLSMHDAVLSVFQRGLTENVGETALIAHDEDVQRRRNETEDQSHFHMRAVFSDSDMSWNDKDVDRRENPSCHSRQNSVERMLRNVNECWWAKLLCNWQIESGNESRRGWSGSQCNVYWVPCNSEHSISLRYILRKSLVSSDYHR